MNGGRSDASTSTDDIKSRPLCLFYFTHPFGVLSAEPPTLAAAPPHIARAFLNMQPVPPWTLWSAAPPAPPAAAAPAAPAAGASRASSSSRPDYELGAATVHRSPLSLVSVPRARHCTLDFGDGHDSVSSSLFSSDMWFNSSAGCRSTEYPRRLVPYNRILPPLRLPSPKDTSNLSSSDDFWPKKCLNPEKFSLPPIELPSVKVNIVRSKKCSASSEEAGGAEGAARGARRRGVRKRRARAAALRRLLAARLRRALAGGAERNVSPALRSALNTIREAWAEPRSLLSRCRSLHLSCVACERVHPTTPAPAPRAPAPAPMERAAAELAPRAGASPGLLRRRYSVPETIMRKYRLAQQRSDSEDSAPATTRSAASASPAQDAGGSAGDSPHRFVRRDRELMRKSALMRRMWGRACGPGPACCCCEPGRETRSLDGSRSELRPLSSAATSRYSHAAAGWATPKRQRLDSSRDFRGSDEMLRAAMKNSYDRAEESRSDRVLRGDFSDSTYRSHMHEPSSSYLETVTDVFTDSESSKFKGHAYTEPQSSDMTTVEVKSTTAEYATATSEQSGPCALCDERSPSASPDTCSASYPTTKESAHFAGRVCARSASLQRDDNDAVPYDQPLSVDMPPSYELLEIVVSETLNVSAVPAESAHALPPDKAAHVLKAPKMSQKCAQNINIDEYVSNILVESLNSLTDQLECMNASMGNDRKISIVEKEIKVKLQNTGVNTIVHLSPTSNNQIIFGNEELCIKEERKDSCNNPHDVHDAHGAHGVRDTLAIRDEAHSVESNNNLTSTGSLGPCPCDSFDLQHDNVNQAVLQQIQKLFQDELHNLDPDMDYSGQTMPEISHIEISNVTDVFIDSEHEPGPPGTGSERAHDGEYELISGVGAGSYYPDVDEQPVVPRFSAFPHTDSMEVNTSSSDDADLMGSDCTSLVDSLDDPNSPRSVLLRRACTGRRSELVRSAIDVLDLLPENARNEDDAVTPKDKGESFFIKIKDNECDCDKENVNVADRMPEKIKQRLYRRHRKRELRMESARRTRGKPRPRDRDPRHERHELGLGRREPGLGRARRDVERECVAIVSALIDDVISKVAQDEYKCMRVRHRPGKVLPARSDDHVAKRTWKKQLEPIHDRDPFKSLKSNTTQYEPYNSRKLKGERHQIHGKLSFVTRPAGASDDRAAKRIYQKSEIHEGNKCIEILEILEYVNGSQSSPETTTSDENQNLSTKNKKSRIPVPIYEKSQKTPNNESNKFSSKRSSTREHNGNSSRLLADTPPSPPAAPAPRSRSNSLRFKQVFDIIPEERSSLSLDSGNEDHNHNRRASAPAADVAHIADRFGECSDAECDDAPPAPAPTPRAVCSPPHTLKPQPDSPRRCRDMKSAGTSPITESDGDKRAHRSKNQTTMTSPGSKSAATSPMLAEGGLRDGAGLPSRTGRCWGGGARGEARAPLDAGYKMGAETDKVRPRRSVNGKRERTQDTRARVDVARQRTVREQRPPAPPPPTAPRARSPCGERARLPLADAPLDRSPDDITHNIGEKRKSRSLSLERSDEDGERAPSVKLPEFKGGGDSGGATSSDSSESGGSLLCALAPRWLAPGRRARRRAAQPPGGWSVTVAGSCRAALPADVEMRLRFPHDARAAADAPCQECTCRHCATCACGARGAGGGAPPLPPAALARLARADSSKLTLTMRKEALDSSILASKSSKKPGEPLPDVETYRASRSKLKSSVKTRRGYSLHCWLPDTEVAPIRPSDALSVLGSAIIPELKPRVPTMSERDLTRVYTPRHYLRS